jgi:2-hydroxycyclohexanecarboxyl-CoA dehydrogenase
LIRKRSRNRVLRVEQRMRGRVAVITGGGGGIGEATGRLFVEECGKVALVDANREAVEAAAKAIGGNALAVAADVSVEKDAARAVDEAVKHFGALHALVNVAGIRVYHALAEAPAEDWQRILAVNVLGTAYCCKAAIPALRKAGGATIVNVSSMYGVRGRKGMGQYDTTKAAVLGLTRALAVEEAPHGIRVNAVLPGVVGTERVHANAASGAGRVEHETKLARIPLGRLAEPTEVVNVVLFLLSTEAAYCTGALFTVDGGFTLGIPATR